MAKIRAVIKKHLGNKKGSAVLEYAIGLLIFVILICFLFDVIIIAHKRYVVSQQVNSLSRKVAIQGGVANSAPVGFPGAIGNGTGSNDTYVTGSEMIRILKINFKDIDINENEWTAVITGYNKNGVPVSITTFDGNSSKLPNNVAVDYGKGIDISVAYKYDWTLFGQILGFATDVSANETRHVFSEFKYDYDKWDGE